MSFAPSSYAPLNASIVSSRALRPDGPLRISFPSGWGNGEVFEWYRRRRATKISKLQLRKERAEPFRHQYIVAILQGDTMLRFDRRGDADVPMDAMTRSGTQAVDTVEEVATIDNTNSDCLAELQFQGGVDLWFIISVCYGIHSDEQAQRYTLQRFNCYFFSWTILAVTARHAVPWETLPFDSPWETLSQMLADTLTVRLTDMLMDMLSQTVQTIVLTFQRRLKSVLWPVQTNAERMLWSLPRSILAFGLRLMVRSSGGPMLHSILQTKLHATLQSTLQKTLKTNLPDLRTSTLRTTLWQDTVKNAMRDAVRGDVMAAVLDAVFDALAAVGSPNPELMHAACIVPPMVTKAQKLFEGRDGGWRAILCVGFYAAIEAAPNFMARSAGGVVTEDANWDDAWNSMRDGSRNAVREAMKEEKDKGWSKVFDAMLDEWDVGWEAGRVLMRDAARKVADEMTEVVNDAVAGSVVNALPDSQPDLLKVSVRNTVTRHVVPLYKSKLKSGLTGVTHSQLQEYIRTLIKSHSSVVGRYRLGAPAQVEVDIRETMNRVWRSVVDIPALSVN